MEKTDKGILGFVIGGFLVSILIAVFMSPFASAFPDGLEKVAENLGFIDKATIAVNESFFAIPDYSFIYISSEKWQGPVAGLFGVLIMMVIFGAVFLIYRASAGKKIKGVNK